MEHGEHALGHQKAAENVDGREHERDEAEGTLAEGPSGRQMMTRVVLRPQVSFTGDHRPTPEELADLHHKAHEECFIANSVTSEVVIEI